MSDAPGVSSSEPIYKAAATIGTVVTGAVALIGTALQLGIISTEQADAYTDTAAAVTGALPELASSVTLIVGLLAGIGGSFATAWHARKRTVPVDSDAYRVAAVTAPLVREAGQTRVVGDGDGIGEHRAE